MKEPWLSLCPVSCWTNTVEVSVNKHCGPHPSSAWHTFVVMSYFNNPASKLIFCLSPGKFTIEFLEAALGDFPYNDCMFQIMVHLRPGSIICQDDKHADQFGHNQCIAEFVMLVRLANNDALFMHEFVD